MRCWTCLWVFSSPFNQTGNKDSAYQIHWYLQNSHHLVSVLVPQPAICPFTGYVGGERRSISHSERRGVWGLIAQRQLMCHRWLMSHEVGGGERERERARERGRAEHHGGFCAALLSSLWSSDILPSTALLLSLRPLQLSLLPFPAHGYELLLQPNTNYLVFIAAPARPYKQVKKKKKKNRVEHDSTSTLRQMGFIFL